MEAETLTLREGDIYRWSYRESGDDRAWGRYHCCSRIAIVHNGRLHDTYWMIGQTTASGGRKFDAHEAVKLLLERLGHFAELEKTHEYNEEYYDDSDIVNLNHANSSRGNFYLRKGATRSAAKMLKTARAKLDKAKYEEKWAAQRAAELLDLIGRIEAGDTSVHL